ncbi:Histone-lysine N-methyltransferase setd7 [Saxophila tyrrhenica]|uniref:Histone-lysine N-methyltransferase setd7 n=1 Tax=Saxophila tyrrhenica TaxID=1690608 RepID=A0AAV9P810_9PEZI|nr:Histone-lysine N-methyltransferase setd7 [Saxophila tyrrhenica]
MAKEAQFRAYDLSGKNPHNLPSPPAKTNQHRFDKEERSASVKPAKVTKSKKAKSSSKKSTADVLRNELEYGCHYCDSDDDDQQCGIACYRDFRKQCKEKAAKVQIRGPGRTGYGVYSKVTIEKDEKLDEYLGELRPKNSRPQTLDSMYVFEFKHCFIDAEKHGNWTRYVNSSCDPNLIVDSCHVGKRRVLIFRAEREIVADEELTFNYKRGYFAEARGGGGGGGERGQGENTGKEAGEEEDEEDNDESSEEYYDESSEEDSAEVHKGWLQKVRCNRPGFEVELLSQLSLAGVLRV